MARKRVTLHGNLPMPVELYPSCAARNRLAVAVTLGLISLPATASVVTVDSALDGIIGSACTLRAAIQTINDQLAVGGCSYSGGSPDSIDFDPALNGQSIVLGQGELVVSASMSINGPGRDLLSISGNGASRVIRVSSGNLTIRSLSVIDGRTSGDGLNHSGAGIRLDGSGLLQIEDSLISGHVTEGNNTRGGAIFTENGDIEITDSAISDNQTLGNGAGGAAIYIEDGDLIIINSLISNNVTAGNFSSGGAIYTDPAGGNLIHIQGSELVNNRTLGNQAEGGAIWGWGTYVEVSDSVISSNRTEGDDSPGGAIYLRSSGLILDRVTLSDNETRAVDSRGGAIATLFGLVDIAESTISGNRTLGTNAPGGALSLRRGDLAIADSSLFDNSTAGAESPGGAIAYVLHTVFSSLNLLNVTISGNRTHGSASPGGGIYASTVSYGISELNLDFVTVTANHAEQSAGGGVAAVAPHQITVRNSLIAGNQDSGSAPDLLTQPDQTLVLDYSLLGINAGTTLAPGMPDASGNIIGTAAQPIDPGLAPLANNGGPTLTHSLFEGSPALDAGDPNFTTPPEFDQRGPGFPRIINGRVDMGAVEVAEPTDLIFADGFEFTMR